MSRKGRRPESGEDNFGLIFHAAADPMAIHDEEGRIIEVNEAALRHHGFSREEMLALGPGGAEPPEYRKHFPERVRRFRKEGSVVFETEHITKDGGRIPVEIHSRPIVYRGRPAILSIARDLRRRKAADESLRQSVERFELVIRASRDAIWDWNLKTGEIYGSPQFYEMLGFAPGEHRPTWQFFESLLHPDDVESVRVALDSQLRTDSPRVTRYRIRTKQGEYRWHETYAVTLRDESGAPVRIAGSSRDITEQKLLSERLEQAQRLDSIGRLAGGIAHDFNNLLTVISGYTELLLEKLPVDDPLRPVAEEIRSAGEKGAALTRQLLAFSRRQVMQPEVMDLNQSIRGMEGMLRRLVGENIEVFTRLRPRLWKVLADASQMNQVLMNLIVNARDSMPNGGKVFVETANIEVTCGDAAAPPNVESGQYVRLTVRDTGAGMDEETRKHVFEPFFTTKRPGAGTGLGLAMVYGIALQSGGFVTFESEVGKGSEFHVCLPRAAERISRPRKIRPEPMPAPRGETILLAEDQPEVAALVRRTLTKRGYRVLASGNADEALRLAKRHTGPIDLLLADVVMPGMSGPELAACLRGMRPGLRVLFISGYPDNDLLSHGILQGEADLVPKPFTPKELVRRVHRALSRQNSLG